MSTLQDQVNKRIAQAKEEHIAGKARRLVESGEPSCRLNDGRMQFGNISIKYVSTPMREPGEGIFAYHVETSIFFHERLVFEEDGDTVRTFLPNIEGWREELEEHYKVANSLAADRDKLIKKRAQEKLDQDDLALKARFGL